MNDFWVVLSNPLDERHAEFNDWYDNIHVRDIMRQPGTAAAQRFRLSGRQIADGGGAVADRSFEYLALYDIYDAQKVSSGQARIFTPVMMVSDSFDFRACGAFYTPIAARRDRRLPDEGDLVVERIVASDDPGFADWYVRVRMAALLALPGVSSGVFTSYADHQMFPVGPESQFIALYRLAASDTALEEWGGAPALPEGQVARVASFDQLWQRLNVFDVAHPTDFMVAAEDAARRSLGDRFYKSFPTG